MVYIQDVGEIHRVAGDYKLSFSPLLRFLLFLFEAIIYSDVGEIHSRGEEICNSHSPLYELNLLIF